VGISSLSGEGTDYINASYIMVSHLTVMLKNSVPSHSSFQSCHMSTLGWHGPDFESSCLPLFTLPESSFPQDVWLLFLLVLSLVKCIAFWQLVEPEIASQF